MQLHHTPLALNAGLHTNQPAAEFLADGLLSDVTLTRCRHQETEPTIAKESILSVHMKLLTMPRSCIDRRNAVSSSLSAVVMLTKLTAGTN